MTAADARVGGPLPVPAVPPTAITAETEPFWSGLAGGRLRLQRCAVCERLIWYPRARCPHCHSADTAWVDAAGTGTVYSYSIVRRGSGAYAAAAPYVVAYVELTEGPRVLTNVVGAADDDLYIGAPVDAILDPADGLLRFRLRG